MPPLKISPSVFCNIITVGYNVPDSGVAIPHLAGLFATVEKHKIKIVDVQSRNPAFSRPFCNFKAKDFFSP